MRKICSNVLSQLLPGNGMHWARRKTITRQKTTDFHVVRALTNMGIVIRKPFVQKELASIFVFATGLVEITGSTKTWTTLEEFIVELYKFYSTKTKDVPYRLKLDDFRALVMEISRARSKYKTWRDSNGMAHPPPPGGVSPMVVWIDKFHEAWAGLVASATAEKPLQSIKDAAAEMDAAEEAWKEAKKANKDKPRTEDDSSREKESKPDGAKIDIPPVDPKDEVYLSLVDMVKAAFSTEEEEENPSKSD